jgi:RNA polymerase sigma-70 factor, ECF subfamily
VGSFMDVTDGSRSDAELLAAHVAGDRDAFKALFDRYHRQLYRLALLTSRSPEDAADSLQDALFSAHRTAPGFRYDASVSSWLYRIVVNASLDRLRRNKTHATVPLVDDAHPRGDPTSRVETALVVERALLRLPVEQRAAVVAVDMHGYSIAETARLLGVPEGTIKSRCARARAKLARSLGYLSRSDLGIVPNGAAGPGPSAVVAGEARTAVDHIGEAAGDVSAGDDRARAR